MPITTSEENLNSLVQSLVDCKRIIVAGHLGPDPDTIGSALGMVLALKSLGKDANVHLYDPIPWKLDFLPGVELIQKELGSEPIDLFILVDAGTMKRIGPEAERAHKDGQIKKWAIIDHHMSTRPTADINYIDSNQSSTGELVYSVVKRLEKLEPGYRFGKAVATCLYSAIVTDTGSFQYSNTTASSLEIAADCIRNGADPDFLSERLFRSMRKARLELLEIALKRLEFFMDGKVGCFILGPDDFNKTSGNEDDADGFANTFLGLEGIEVILYFRQMEGNPVKLSMRGKGLINLSELCAALGGGGHAKAAGATLEGSLESEKERLLAVLEERFKA